MKAKDFLDQLFPDEEYHYHAVDFDGTLAVSNHSSELGIPIPEMVDRVKQWLENGENVEILTARVAEGEEVVQKIREWCKEHLGKELEVTNIKKPGIIDIWDDRARRVERNTGKIL